jgi:hypothetical protein
LGCGAEAHPWIHGEGQEVGVEPAMDGLLLQRIRLIIVVVSRCFAQAFTQVQGSGRLSLLYVFHGGKERSFPTGGHQKGFKKQNPSGGHRRGESQNDNQNPRGAPMTADTTTAERLEKPIQVSVIVAKGFMKFRRAKGLG